MTDRALGAWVLFRADNGFNVAAGDPKSLLSCNNVAKPSKPAPPPQRLSSSRLESRAKSDEMPEPNGYCIS